MVPEIIEKTVIKYVEVEKPVEVLKHQIIERTVEIPVEKVIL
jgi:hypothetical protein